MNTRMTLYTHDAAAIDVLDAIRAATGITLVARVRGRLDHLAMDGEHSITLDVVDVPAIEILEAVLEECSFDRECTWQLRGSVVEVGTKDRLAVSAAQEVRYYPVGDLLLEVPDYPNAPPFDLDSALGQSGSGGGGAGGGGAGGGGGGGGEGGAMIIGAPGEEPARRDKVEQGQRLVDLIRSVIEPDGWRDNGGDWASIRLYQDCLVVRAPDFVHRQISGRR